MQIVLPPIILGACPKTKLPSKFITLPRKVCFDIRHELWIWRHMIQDGDVPYSTFLPHRPWIVPGAHPTASGSRLSVYVLLWSLACAAWCFKNYNKTQVSQIIYQEPEELGDLEILYKMQIFQMHWRLILPSYHNNRVRGNGWWNTACLQLAYSSSSACSFGPHT